MELMPLRRRWKGYLECRRLSRGHGCLVVGDFVRRVVGLQLENGGWALAPCEVVCLDAPLNKLVEEDGCEGEILDWGQ